MNSPSGEPVNASTTTLRIDKRFEPIAVATRDVATWREGLAVRARRQHRPRHGVFAYTLRPAQRRQ